MKNTKVLEMLDNGDIQKLRLKLAEEIYIESLKGKRAKERYKAMKRFVRYNQGYRHLMPNNCIAYPKKIDGEYYFTNGCCIVVTTEDIGIIQQWQPQHKDFLDDVTKIISPTEIEIEEKCSINIRKILNTVKAKVIDLVIKPINFYMTMLLLIMLYVNSRIIISIQLYWT